MPKLILVSLASIILLLPLGARAQVLINEIAWMGTTVSANDEWLELYNSGNEAVSLTGWRLVAIDGSPVISLTGSIAANGYFLLERTDDETVPEIPADQIFSGSISNTGEHFQLFDNFGNLIDEAPFTTGWPGGDNTTKQTLERSSVESWETSLEPNGTPKAKNSTIQKEESEEPEEPECPPVPECPPIPECPECLQCPEIPECPQCPEIPECPQIPDLNSVINVSANEILNITDGQKIRFQGMVKKRPILFFGHLLLVDNLKIMVLDLRPPRLRLNNNIEIVGRLLQTPAGPILIVYQADDIKVIN